MICAQCFDDGKGEIDMVHLEGVIDFHDPGASHGHGQRETCWYECPVCKYVSDCDNIHNDYEE